MFAIIKTGGKQYRVAQDETIRVEKLDAEQGTTVEFDDVLMVGNADAVTVGAPTVAGAKVTAEVVGHDRDKKVLIFKKRRRKNSRRLNGHRQHKTVLKITAIAGA